MLWNVLGMNLHSGCVSSLHFQFHLENRLQHFDCLWTREAPKWANKADLFVGKCLLLASENVENLLAAKAVRQNIDVRLGVAVILLNDLLMEKDGICCHGLHIFYIYSLTFALAVTSLIHCEKVEASLTQFLRNMGKSGHVVRKAVGVENYTLELALRRVSICLELQLQLSLIVFYVQFYWVLFWKLVLGES